jgi:anti-sigma-K factor RskA
MLAAASLLITTLALGFALLRTQRELDRLRARIRELEEISSVLRSPGAKIIHMAGQQPHSGGALYWDTQGNRWIISVGLPPPPPGKVYQLWFVTPEAKISAGLIDTDASGHGFAMVRVPPEMTQIAAAAITLEPAGGSQQPTMPIYAIGKTQ